MLTSFESQLIREKTEASFGETLYLQGSPPRLRLLGGQPLTSPLAPREYRIWHLAGTLAFSGWAVAGGSILQEPSQWGLSGRGVNAIWKQ